MLIDHAAPSRGVTLVEVASAFDDLKIRERLRRRHATTRDVACRGMKTVVEAGNLSGTQPDLRRPFASDDDIELPPEEIRDLVVCLDIDRNIRIFDA